MIGVIFLLVILYGINQAIFSGLAKKHAFFSKKLMNQLFGYHLVFGLIYYLYALVNNSDSHNYYSDSSTFSGNWFQLFGTGTTFIDFLAFPFSNLMGFSYEMMMLLFTWFGYLGFVYAYLFFRENIPVKVKVFGNIDLLTLILFFPNMHFWTASLGKGAPIFFGIMLFVYAMKDAKNRKWALIWGGLITYFIRPHIFAFLGVGAVLGYMGGDAKISFRNKIIIYVGVAFGLWLAQDQILAVVNMQNTDNFVDEFQQFTSTKAEKLSGSAGSGVNMNSYPLPYKFFTFWFRPLFFDAPNILGLITSVENLMYLLLFFKILKKDFVEFLQKSPVVVKMSFVVFISTSYAMTFVMSNLGIIMRQKSMVMYFIFFVIYYYLAQKKYTKFMRLKKWKLKRELELQKKAESVTS